MRSLPRAHALLPGPLATASLYKPSSLALLPDGEIAIADDYSIAILR